MEKTFKTIYPRAKLNLLAMSILEIVFFIRLNVSDDQGSKFFYSFMTIMILTYLIVLLKMLFTKLTFTLGTDYVICSKANKYESSQIESIYMSYKRIGFKLNNRRLVPMNLCFYFDKDEEDGGLRELNEWAEHNKIEVKDKFFQTLM
ncbi:hypothetical protein [Paenibacillus xylanilyticus]|uniref:Uncharacterized protein n=1 Tax=Paenibacillus xylanilyticus TaxID=248903 RepID=A0A7Y6BTS0_9BACL|nr:hypothetical protein [Paenibacillus xylanilyticus]NUU74448.1 hypothetical protein [Paenibacillus xylanilyticus]